MLTTSWLLAALAVALAWPVPVLLSRATWPSRSPVAAMILWQGVALAGGLSMIGAFLTWGLAPAGHGLVPALIDFAAAVVGGRPFPELTLIHVFALSVAGLLSIQLLLTLLRSAWRLRRHRMQHRSMLALLARSHSDTTHPGTLVIEHATPAAYCLPGSGSVTVLTSGLIGELSPAELRAVLAHESAHLTQRHDLLLLAFTSWQAALPWLPTTRLALTAVAELVEELADDAAMKTSSRTDLLGALAVVAAGAAPAQAGGTQVPDATVPGPTSSGTESSNTGPSGSTPVPDTLQGSLSETLSSARLQRLFNPAPPLPTWASVTVVAGGVALVAAPTAALLATGWGA
ncbi:MAG: M56 family metallopeptidase [Galactobacter sp.]|uniref:M56 family metallopeptidase n=1 Tax=Galactobacter sp. TaxID=2676125 RepID=UPI0025BB6884|nr:M56 family metallopeptidase [Galactobacter sp.]